MPKVLMKATCAKPDMILEDGKVYMVSKELAEQLMAAGSATVEGAPAAVEAPRGVKSITPGKPDPGESLKSVVTDDDDEGDDDADDA